MDYRKANEILSACCCRQSELYGEWARAHGIGYNTAMVLYAMDQEQVWTQKQLAAELAIPKQTVNTVVKELERKGCLRFAPGKNLKEKTLCLTEEGKRYAGEKLRPLYEAEERALALLGEERAAQLVELTAAYSRIMEEVFRHG